MKYPIAGFMLWTTIMPLPAYTHHSQAEFDRNRTEEVQGEVTRVLWTNPHVRLTLVVPETSAAQVIWEVVSDPVSRLVRKGIPRDIVKAGDRVTVAGFPSSAREHYLMATHLRISDGTEYILLGDQPRWTERAVGLTDPQAADATDIIKQVNGIFRVWSLDSLTFGRFSVSDDLPLSAWARQQMKGFREPAEWVTNCTPAGMPLAMGSPFPIEFVKQDGDIRINIEESNNVRIVHMSEPVAPEQRRGGPLGYSVGKWDAGILVVRTTNIDFPYFSKSGIPLTRQAVIEERFFPGDGNRLDYEMTVYDERVFTTPVTYRSHWIWRAGVEIMPYECTPDEVFDHALN